MKMTLSDGKEHSVFLCDDGTLDTVVSVDGIEGRFDMEFASAYRSQKTGALSLDGLRVMAEEVLEDFPEDNAQ